MAARPNIPVTREEMYLDVMTGGSSSLPEPITHEEKYLAKIAGMAVDLPTPVPIKHKYLAKIAGMTVNVPTYTTNLPRIYAYLAKAAGQDVNVPQPITREEMYWFDYVGGQPAPPEREYTGAVPVTFIADGTPLLDYLISGNTAQNGTPAPDNPIMPEGTGGRTGNLLDKSASSDADTSHINYNKNAPIFLTAGQTYTFSCDTVCNGLYIRNVVDDGALASANNSNTLTYTPQINVRAYCRVWNNNGITNLKPMLNSGSTPLPYEPYGYKVPILSANTTTPVYLGEVHTTRKIRKYIFTGEENITNIGGYYNTNVSVSSRAWDITVSTTGGFQINNSGNRIWAVKATFSDCTTPDAFKTYLQQQYANGTPVTVWYVLAIEETAVVNEPLMKIGDYADAVSMEQAGVEIPTVNGSNALDVLTSVKPSEVYIKYKGEPVAGSQTSSQSSAYAPAEVSGQSENADDINSNLLGKKEETE